MARVESSFSEIEASVSNRNGSYQGLCEEALLTNKQDYLAIFSSVSSAQSWIELGSGHGLGPVLFAQQGAGKTAIGIEFERSRFEASEELKKNHQLSNVEFRHQDLLACKIPVGDAYFFYFPTGPVLDRILCELGSYPDGLKIIAVESHGDFLQRLNRESWLRPVQHIPLTSSRYFPNAVVYEKVHDKSPSLHDCSFQHKYLLIEEETGEQWLGESHGMEWMRESQFQCLIPPRSFEEHQVDRILSLNELPELYHLALRLRPMGTLKIVTSDKVLEGQFRKIYVSPSFKLEISTGEQVEWDHIQKIFLETTLCFDSSSGYSFYPPAV